MKWRDSGDSIEKEEDTKEEFFDEEQYSPWADGTDSQKRKRTTKMPLLLILLVGAIIALIAALLMLIFNGSGGAAGDQEVAALQQRLRLLEDRFEKYDAIDEKVTRIWEQAKSFEKFKDRFDRTEASMSLRMDHLTMSLEALQKQLTQARKQPAEAPAVADQPEASTAPKAAPVVRYHEVAPGDTLYSISKKYDLKVEDLLTMNRMKPGSVIVPGQKLIVRSADKQ